ncbi:MAG TPA: flagellar hook-basal body complex protein FliE [Bryobacteraceae bacterium]|jgi:flagellar hook-basal body complex protein FliE
MSLKISGLPIQPPAVTQAPSLDDTATDASSGASFKDVLSSTISGLEQARGEANQGIDNFLTGEGSDLHSVVLASQRAELEFDLFLQVRNKVVNAYQEVMRMQM